MFSKKAILKAMDRGLLQISPFDESQIESAHINLHLSGDIAKVIIPAKGFVLAQTADKLTLADSICGLVEGRASLAKKGISVEQSSTFVEPGTDNTITLEIFNASDDEVVINPGDEIAKLFILKVIDDI